jgi:hypothetical protein
MDRIVQTYSEMKIASVIGGSLCNAPEHLVRLIKLFLPAERQQLLQHAFLVSKEIQNNDYSIGQFIAFVLFTPPPFTAEEESEAFLTARGLTPLRHISPPHVKLENLNAKSLSLVQAVLSGEKSFELAQILGQAVVGDLDFLPADVANLLSKVFEKPITRPELAAGFDQCLKFNQELMRAFKVEAKLVTDYARLISFEEFEEGEESDIHAVLHDVETGLTIHGSLEERLNVQGWNEHTPDSFAERIDWLDSLRNSPDLTSLDTLQSALQSKLDLETRFQFVESPYGLLVPAKQFQLLSKDFSKILDQAKQDRSHLLSLSPRAFEMFIGDLFKALGYQVEVTQKSRDGGADIICLQNQNGIPFKFAVEVKRYKESRPIGVALVRSFVGANKQFEADKLIYVTTSSYTQSALEYADKYARHLLSLKGYEQIREWCNDVRKGTWRLLE